MKIRTEIASFFILMLLMVPFISYEQEGTGTLQIAINYPGNLEMADYHGMGLKIYQDNGNIPIKTIKSITGNPYAVPLQLGHVYKVELYVNGMFASVDYISLTNDNQVLAINAPLTGSVRFIVQYNDFAIDRYSKYGYTPVNNATVMVKSKDGSFQYWTNSTTDAQGKSIRFWLQPTLSNDNYYVATFSIGNGLSYSYSPIEISPGQSTDIQIVTPWPSSIPLVDVSVYKSASQKVSTTDGSFVVNVYDDKGNKITQSQVDKRGVAHFSDFKVGSYFFRATQTTADNDREWGSANLIIDGKQTSFKIFKDIYVPSWVTNLIKLAMSGQITEQELEIAVNYLYEKAIIN